MPHDGTHGREVAGTFRNSLENVPQRREPKSRLMQFVFRQQSSERQPDGIVPRAQIADRIADRSRVDLIGAALIGRQSHAREELLTVGHALAL